MSQDIVNVLIVDDEAELRKSLAAVLSSQLPDLSFSISEACNGKQALDAIDSASFDLVLMDVRMPEMDGLEALEEIKKRDPRVFVMIMTAHANFKDAVEAIKFGAYDYIEKPVQPEKLKEVVTKALETRQMVQDLSISSPIFDDDIDSKFVGDSRKMREVFSLIYKLSHVDTTVLIRGENGTGKELVAKAIHYNSPRKHGEFIAINCGAIPENLIESEFFGHEKGAFTGAISRKIGKFQLANKGTIFLDEVGELRPEMQVKLLRVLQERKFTPIGGNREVRTNARIVAATNRNLEKMIEDREFREDFFYRLNVMPIFLPPLRERIEDLPLLISHFVKKFSTKYSRDILGVEDEVQETLKRYDWPGNIRELENVIERAFVVETADRIRAASLPEHLVDSAEHRVEIPIGQQSYRGPLDFDQFKEQSEKEFILRALKANSGRINKTVAEANIPKNTLLRKIKKYEIDVKQIVEEAQSQ